MYEVEIGYTLTTEPVVLADSVIDSLILVTTIIYCYMMLHVFRLFKVQMCLHFKHMLHSVSLVYLKQKISRRNLVNMNLDNPPGLLQWFHLE
jgi:hypothetical protein